MKVSNLVLGNISNWQFPYLGSIWIFSKQYIRTSITSGDFNNDEKSDLLVINHDSYDLSIFLNDC